MNTQLKRGFTLIEVMVVVVIIGILAAIVVPKIISRPDQAKVAKAKADIQNIDDSLDLYKLDNGTYPTTAQGLQALVTKPTSAPAPTNWHGYLKSLPMDPWGHEYHYQYPGQHGTFDVFTYGANNEPGGTGYDAEIGNWNLSEVSQ